MIKSKDNLKNNFSDTSLDKKVEIAFKNQIIMSVYQSIPRNYHVNFCMSEVEIHSLGFIGKYPGITAKKLGDLTYRTKGTISSMISQFEKLELVEQKINIQNKREHQLFLTTKGKEINEEHIKYDRKAIRTFIEEMLKQFSEKEVENFFEMLNFRSEYFENFIKNKI